MPYTASRDIPYDNDAAAIFDGLAQSHDSLLLESADIETKKSLNCLAILRAALKVTCHGHRVEAQVLTKAGETLLPPLCDRFRHRLVSRETTTAVFEFSPSAQPDERKRLLAESTADILRFLQLEAIYSSPLLPFLGGGFAYDYLATFEDLPEVKTGADTYPDYEFLVAQTVLEVNHLQGTARIEGWDIDQRRLNAELDSLAARPEAPRPTAPQKDKIRAVADTDDAAFRAGIEKLQRNIHAGDIYQVVPARSFTLECPNALAAYRALRETNPSPFTFAVRAMNYLAPRQNPTSGLRRKIGKCSSIPSLALGRAGCAVTAVSATNLISAMN